MDNLGASLSAVFSEPSNKCVSRFSTFSNTQSHPTSERNRRLHSDDFFTSKLYGKVHNVPFDCLEWSGS